MSEPGHDYRIDYDAPDVVDLVRQIRSRTGLEAGADPLLPTSEADPRARLRDYLDLDDRRPYALQEDLGLGGDWNVTPEDLRSSRPGPAGALIGGLRSLLRPFTKLLANLDLPLYKQFKVNLGTAAALRDVMESEAALRRRVADLEQRISRLEAGSDGPEAERR